MAPTVEPIGSSSNVIGEGPHWDQKEQVLYYVDIPSSLVKKYDPKTKKETFTKVEGGPVSLVIPIEGRENQFVIGLGRNISILTWDGQNGSATKVEHVCTVDNEAGKLENRFNDGKVDPAGRFWAGTMGPESSPAVVDLGKGSLFSVSSDGSYKSWLTDISISNGLAWSKDLKTMYYIDSLALSVDALDYDSATGAVSNRRVAFDFKANGINAFPDGMTIDTEDNLWIACFNGGQVIRVDPKAGKLLGSISVPSPQTTSVTFGGKNLDELYVTSANNHLSEDLQKKYPYAGFTFRITNIGARGYPGKNAVFKL